MKIQIPNFQVPAVFSPHADRATNCHSWLPSRRQLWKAKSRAAALHLAALMFLGGVVSMSGQEVNVGEGHISGTVSLNDTMCNGNSTLVSDFLNSGVEGISGGEFKADSATSFTYYNPPYPSPKQAKGNYLGFVRKRI